MIDSSFSPRFSLAWAAPAAVVQCRQNGGALIVSLVMLIAVSLLGMSAAQIALDGARAAYNERDRQLAFHAAEAALLDAELGIQNTPDGKQPQNNQSTPNAAPASPPLQKCITGNGKTALGPRTSGQNNALSASELIQRLGDANGAETVPYGLSTGQSFPVGEGPLPGKLPRYIIELLPDRRPGQDATENGRRTIYRITAIGFGMRETTQVVLQTIYRKAN